MRHALRWFAHHPQHGQATRADKANDEDRCQGEEEHIEDTGVVPLHSLGNRHYVAVLRNDTEGLEKKLDHLTCCRHRDVEHQQDIAHDAPAVIFAINSKNGQDNQVGKDEADNTTKANPPSPQDGSQGHIANRAHKTDKRDNGPTSGSSIFETVGLLEKKNAFQNELGTHAARASAMSNPRYLRPLLLREVESISSRQKERKLS